MFAAVLCFLASTAFAQRFHSRVYSESDGLPSTAVFGIGQDARGRMLFLTRSAISRFDGARWDSLDCGLRVADPYHQGLVLAPDGSMWTADGGDELRLFVLGDGDCWRQVPPPAFAGARTVVPTAVTAIPAKVPPVIAVGTTAGDVAAWSGERWFVVRLGADSGGGEPVRGLVGHAGGRVTAATASTLYTVDLAAGTATPWRPAGLPDGDILAVAADPDDARAVWLLGAGWLVRATDTHAEVISATLRVGTEPTRAVVQPDGLGSVVAVAGGDTWLVDVSTGHASTLDSTSGLGSSGGGIVFLDRERNLWFGSERGVTKIGDRRLVSYTREHGLLEDEVTAILAASTGDLVLGHPSGLSFMTGSEARHTVDSPSGPGCRVMDLAEDADGSIWIAAARCGLLRLGGDGRLERAPVDPTVREVYAVARDSELGVVVGTDRGLLTRDRSGLWSVVPAPAIAGARRIVSGPSGRLAVATSGSGLLLRERGAWSTVTSPDEPEANQVYTLSGSDPTWVGTRAGLFWNDGGALRRPLDLRLHLHRPVFMLLSDRQNRLWIGTDHGLFRWDGTELVRFSTSTGLAGNELNRAAAYEDDTGHLWFGTDRGLSCYRTTLDAFTPEPPRVDAIWVDTGDGLSVLDRPVTLPAATSTLRFDVHAISWVDERATEVRSRLIGVDSDWQSMSATGQVPVARYTNLAPGRYVLEVQARSPTRQWSPVVRSPAITILAPLWRRTWFQTLAGLSIIAGLATVVGVAHSRRRAALTDAVTGELNREGLRIRLGGRLRRSGRERFGLLVARVDRFEAVVASLGHGQGDALLAQAARRLRARLPGCDIGRLEGSTFGVLLETGSGEADDSPVRDVQLLLAQPFSIDGHEVVSTVTCGFVADHRQDTDPEHLLRDAVAALRHAADEGSGERKVFRPELREQTLRDLQLEADLRRALDGNELELEFQPILDTTGRTLVGLEALLRWRHPRLGDLLPEDFLEMAGSTGLMVPLGGWALQHAANAYAQLGRRHQELRGAVLHVNLHPHQLRQKSIVSETRRALESSGLRPRQLSLELTEQALMRHPRQAAQTLTELRGLGVGLCLDDFGTGHSSLSLLRRFPFDTLKIDRSFVSGLDSPEGRAIVAAIVELARALELAIIAEGVETESQLEQLRRLGCHGLQGFLLARPMTTPRLVEWLASPAVSV